MNAAALLAFNARKTTLQQELWPAVVTFAKTGATEYTVSFGEKDNEGELHDTGQLMQNHRIGVLYFPVLAAFTPGLTSVFTVKSGSQTLLAGNTYRVDRVVGAPGETVLKCYCTRREG